MAMVLEFKINNNLFAIEMKYIKTLFEVEKIKKVYGLPKYVLGLVEHNHQIYPLISLNQAWYNKEDNPENKNAFVLILENKEFAILIDEIVKITEADKSENEFLEVFKDKDSIIGSLDLKCLKNLQIPTFVNKKIDYLSKYKINLDNNYLLFFLGDKIYGIDAKLIKKTEDIAANDEIIKIDKQIIKVEKLKEILNVDAKENNLIILKDNNKILGINVGDIIDLKSIDESEIFKSSGEIFDKYFIYKDKEVKIFNNEFLKNLIAKKGISEKEKEKEKRSASQKVDILIVKIGNEKFAIRMKNIEDLKEIEDINISHTYTNDFIKGIVSTKVGAVYLISYEKLLNQKTNPTRVLVVKNSDTAKAILIDDVLDLISVEKDNIIFTNKNDYFVGGVVLYKDDMIDLININWPTKEYLNANKT